MDIKRNGSRPSTKAPEAYFTGAVRVEAVFQIGDPIRFNAGSVTFERTATGRTRFTLTLPLENPQR